MQLNKDRTFKFMLFNEVVKSQSIPPVIKSRSSTDVTEDDNRLINYHIPPSASSNLTVSSSIFTMTLYSTIESVKASKLVIYAI